MAQYIKKIMITNTSPTYYGRFDVYTGRPVINDNHWLDAEHIISATHLRRNNPVRKLLSGAPVAGFLQHRGLKFSELMHDYPSFGVDLLLEIRSALKKTDKSSKSSSFEDPIRGQKLGIA
ncbi:hypothetical protein N7488_003659 [Penicillium malachiteum]|nr:hypothetical protein N7488_003659 [Penicillium malachiteum]